MSEMRRWMLVVALWLAGIGVGGVLPQPEGFLIGGNITGCAVGLGLGRWPERGRRARAEGHGARKAMREC